MDLLKRPTNIAEPFPQIIAARVKTGSSDNYNRGTCLKFKNSYSNIYIKQDATLHSLFYLETALHVSGGTTTHHQERKQLSTASGICHTVTICRYRGRVGTGLSVLCTLKPVQHTQTSSSCVHTQTSSNSFTIVANRTGLSVLCTLRPVPTLPR